jgi:hypothetical protein
MKKINEKLTMIAAEFSGKTGRIALLVAVIALFVLSAAAPNATIGIGK